jgi:CheY-like chemotaxis protein
VTATTILVADDQADLRRLLRLLLTRGTDWEILEAVDGDDALAVVAAHEVSAVVLDQRMPSRSGLEVAGVLRERGFTGPIVIFSAYLEPKFDGEAARLGVRSVPKGDIVSLGDVLRAALPTA